MENGEPLPDRKEFSIIHRILAETEPTTDKEFVMFASNLIYDEYLTGRRVDETFMRNNPLFSVRRLPQERFGPHCRERELLELFATLKVATHVPGMTWSEFSKLTPDRTEWVLDIAKRCEKAAAATDAKLAATFANLKNNTA